MRFARVHDLVIAHALAKLAIFVFEPLQTYDVFNGEQQLFGRKRLFEKINGT